jgi:hypothetical protein
LSSGAVGVSDSTASKSKAVQFKATVPPPTPSPTPPPSGFSNGCLGQTWKVVDGQFPLSWDWTTAHSHGGKAFNVVTPPNPATLKCARVHNHEDGWGAREQPSFLNQGTFVWHDTYMTGIRDDMMEDDNQVGLEGFMPGTISNILGDGVWTFLSEQNQGSGSPYPSIGPNEDPYIHIDHAYIRLTVTNANEVGGGKWFKWQGRGLPNHKLKIADSVFAVDKLPKAGWSSLDIPAGTIWSGTNYILWLGPTGGYGGPKPAGTTFLEGQAALDKWNFYRNGWLSAHCFPTKAANDLYPMDDAVAAPSC